MWQLSYRPEVEDDLVDATLWYDEKNFGLGGEFIAEYLVAIHRIHDNPLLFAVAANGLRPCRIRRFSYIVHFTVDRNDILVIAVMNSSRGDSVFANRIG